MATLWKRFQHLAITSLLTLADTASVKVGNVVIAAREFAAMGMAGRLVTHTATGALSLALHEGRINLLGEVGGDAAVTLTLPAATGSGARFLFVVSVVNTSGYVIAAAGDDTMKGAIVASSTTDTPDLAQPWVTAADSDTITLNGTTKGGVSIGDHIELVDILPDVWMVRGLVTASGVEATPFSAAA